MNILIYVPQMAAYGGMERHVCTLALDAVARGHSVRFLTTSNSLNAATRSSLVDAGIDFRELAQARGAASAPVKMLWLWRETRRARNVRWDIIYTNGQSALASTLWRAARPGTHIIHHHHTAADLEEQKSWSPRFKRLLMRAPELVACSVATRDNLSRHAAHMPIFLPYFTAAPVSRGEVSDKRYESDAPLHFGFIGRLVSTKGIDTLCALSERAELANVTWHIFGSGPDFPANYFARFPTIHFHGPYRDQAHYGEILRGLDAVALYSQHNEGMPLSLLEAMSAGLPWVATDRGGTRELSHASPANTVLIQVSAHYPAEEGALAGTCELVARIHRNTTSRTAQRAIYDAHYSPEVVSRAWFDYFERSTPDAVSFGATPVPARQSS